MNRQLSALGVAMAGLLASCSSPPPNHAAAAIPQPQLAAARRPTTPVYSEPIAPPLTLESYKHDFARRVASHASPAVFSEPLPKMLKSVVVVEVTINRDGRLTHASIRRSNGYKNLENTALNAVHQAAPFAAPARAIRRSDGSVNFLETFLFRDDGRFQIRTLAEPQ